jgi:hypothetical protein
VSDGVVVRDATPLEAAPWAPIPPGHKVVMIDNFARPKSPWRPATAEESARYGCRWTVGPGHLSCRRTPVVMVNRSRGDKPNWWAYCERHLYNQVIENGRLLGPRLVLDDGGAS